MNNTQILALIILIVFSYLLGAIPTAYIVCKKIANVDIREQGSGNVGAINTRRVVGTIPAVGVLIFDVIKGVIPVLIAKYVETKYQIFVGLSILPVLIAFITVFGHTKSIFINFTGGKGAATGLGTLLVLYWPVGLIVFISTVILSKVTKFRSLGIFTVVPASALLMWLFKQPASYIIYCVVISLYMFYLYRSNLKNYLEKGTSD